MTLLHKRTGTILFLFAVQVHAIAQLQWVKTFGGAIDGHIGGGLAMSIAPDGSIYGTSGYAGTIDVGGGLTANINGTDVLVMKLSNSGELIWTKGFGGSSFFSDLEYGRHIAVNALHNQVVVGGEIQTLFTVDTIVFDGTTNSTNSSSFLAGFDTDGNIQWGRSISCNMGSVSLYDMHVSDAGVTYGFGYSTCQTQVPGAVPQTIGPGGFVVKYGSNGDLLAAETPGQQGASINAVAWMSSSEWLIVGEAIGSQATIYGQSVAPPPGQNYVGYLVRSDTLGNPQWTKTLPSTGASACYATAYQPNGLVYVLGYFFTDVVLDSDTLRPMSGSAGYFLAALDTQGAFQWTLPISGVSVSDRRISLAPDGSVYVSGDQYNDTLWIGEMPYPEVLPIDWTLFRRVLM